MMKRKELIKRISNHTLCLPLYLAVLVIGGLLFIAFRNSFFIGFQISFFAVSLGAVLINLKNLNKAIGETINYMIAMAILGLELILVSLLFGGHDLPLLFSTLVLGIIAIFIGIQIEGKKWNEKMQIWIEHGKIDLDEGTIKTLSPWYIPKSEKSIKSSIWIYGFSGMGLIWARFIVNVLPNLKGIAYYAGLLSLVLFYAVGIFLRRLFWIFSYQKEHKIVFYNELGNHYSIKEIFKKKRIIHRR